MEMRHNLSMHEVGRRILINSKKMDFRCYPSMHKINNKLDGMIYGKNIIFGNYQLFY